MTKGRTVPGDRKQINPTISLVLDERLDDFAGIYEAEKYFVLNVALQYGVRHFKKAWDEYHAQRKMRYRDADDEKRGSAKAASKNTRRIK